MAIRTNHASKFSPFSLPLANGATLTGISYIPPNLTSTPNGARPLLVNIHGAVNTGHYYDTSPEYSGSVMAERLGLPVVAIHRPCYAESTSFLPLPAPAPDEDVTTTATARPSSSFYHETAHWLHLYIFPVVWTHFGVPNGCTALVTNSHSMAAAPSLIAAATFCRERAGAADSPAYPLGGLILSGWGTRPVPHDWNAVGLDFGNIQPGHVTWPDPLKRMIMMSEPELDAADQALLGPLVDAQNRGPGIAMPLEEMSDLMRWPTYWPVVAPQITLPIFFGLGDQEWLWTGSQAHLDEIHAGLVNCPRFDGSVVLGAPHALEWSYGAQGWWARCFGWAVEVAAAMKREEDLKKKNKT